jgi:hypothetical protein
VVEVLLDVLGVDVLVVLLDEVLGVVLDVDDDVLVGVEELWLVAEEEEVVEVRPVLWCPDPDPPETASAMATPASSATIMPIASHLMNESSRRWGGGR